MALRPEQDFHHAFGRSAAHRVNAIRKRILLANQAVDINRRLFQQIKRGTKAPTPRADDRDLINHDPCSVQFRFSMKSRLQDQLALWTEQVECEPKPTR